MRKARRRGGRGVGSWLGVYVCLCVFEEKHISLLLLPPSLFFLPADLHSRWVGLLLFSPSFFSRLLLLSTPSREDEKNSTPNARCSLFFRYEKLRGAQEQGKRSASIKRSSSLFLSLYFFSLYDRAAIAAPTLTQLALHNDNNGEIKAIKITRAKREPRVNPRWH